jgi:hypothetical protein
MRRIVEEKPPPPTYVDRAYPPALELVVMRALEKRPENRHQTAGELFQDLEEYLVAAGARTRNHHIAQYVHDLFAADAAVSEMGVRRARAFEDDVGDQNQLDLDRPAPGAGKAFADALRAAGPYVPESAERGVATVAPAIPLVQRSVVPSAEHSAAVVTGPPSAAATGEDEENFVIPMRRLRVGFVFGLIIASAAAVGLLLALARV